MPCGSLRTVYFTVIIVLIRDESEPPTNISNSPDLLSDRLSETFAGLFPERHLGDKHRCFLLVFGIILIFYSRSDPFDALRNCGLQKAYTGVILSYVRQKVNTEYGGVRPCYRHICTASY